MNKENTQAFLDSTFDSWFVPGLSDFVRVPNLTPMVDPDYLTNGKLDQAIECVDTYVRELQVAGLTRTVFRPEGKNPLIVYVVEGSSPQAKNVMVYGHLDKQPHFTGWDEGLSPIDPVIKDGKMYGRGSSDDGYSVFACMLAVKAG